MSSSDDSEELGFGLTPEDLDMRNDEERKYREERRQFGLYSLTPAERQKASNQFKMQEQITIIFFNTYYFTI